MSWIASKVPNIDTRPLIRCPRCGHPQSNILPVNHQELCEYFIFRDKIADELGWSELPETLEPIHLMSILDEIHQPYKSFHMSGLGGNYYEIFAGPIVASALTSYYQHAGYAGLELEEYLRKICTSE